MTTKAKLDQIAKQLNQLHGEITELIGGPRRMDISNDTKANLTNCSNMLSPARCFLDVAIVAHKETCEMVGREF